MIYKMAQFIKIGRFLIKNSTIKYDGPTIKQHENDKKIKPTEEEWYHGQSHRVDGPAEANYADDKPARKVWYLNGQQRSEPKNPTPVAPVTIEAKLAKINSYIAPIREEMAKK